MIDIKPNQRLVIDYEKSADLYLEKDKKELSLLENVDNALFVHKENVFDDYKREVLLPNKMSRLGPFISAGDVNDDGLDDFFVGGAIGQAGALLLQSEDGFVKSIDQPWESDAACEDLGSVFVDIDGDNDLDLYGASGGYQREAGDARYRDRLYLNDGKGFFVKAAESQLPDLRTSTGAVAAADEPPSPSDTSLRPLPPPPLPPPPSHAETPASDAASS